MYKNRKAKLSKQVLAGLAAGVLLGSVCYVQPAAATTYEFKTQDDYDNSALKDASGNITVTDDRGNYNYIIGAADGTGPTFSGTDIYGVAAAGVLARGENNRIELRGGTVEHITVLYYSGSGNTITISGGTVTKDVKVYSDFGAGEVCGNSIIVQGGEITGNVYNGVPGGGEKIVGNSVTVTDGKVGGDVFGGLSGSGTPKELSGNYVEFSGGEVTGKIYGAQATNNGTTAATNYVKITGGTVINEVYGAHSAGDVTGNYVEISGDTTKVNGDNVYGGYSTTGTATGNYVRITGGEVTGDVYGGYADSGAATGNKVLISGTPTFGNDTVLHGGFAGSGGTASGNELHISTKNITVANVKDFDVFNFYLQDGVANGDTLLTLTGGTANEGTDISNSTVNVGMAGSSSALKQGDAINLMANANGITAAGAAYGQLGVSIAYEFTTALSADGKNVVATVSKGPAKTTEQSKSPVETQLAAAAFINSGADTVAGSGIASAVQVAGSGSAEMFGAMSGGSMRYKSGSYADVQGYNMALGLAKAVANTAGKLTYGSLLEYGWGNYTSHLDSGIRADGNSKYYGIGLLARQDNNSGVYYEGSLRYGRMDSDYGSGDMIGAAGSKVYASYDSSSAYYGAHLGIGKVSRLNDSIKADLYAKLLYTHQNGDSVTLGGAGNGEVYDFDAVDSTRGRVGARLSKDYSEHSTGYVGVAYEYEFDGEARATVKGFSTPSPSIKGSSGLLELGYILQPKSANDPAINIGLQGWGGKKQGVTGNVNFVWTF